MKTIVTVCFVFFLSLSLAGQDLFTSLTEKYASKEGFSATNLTRDMFDLYLRKKQVEPNSPVSETLRKLNNILVVSQSIIPGGKTEDKPADVVQEIHNTILSHYKSQSFTLLKTENRMGEDLKVYLKKNGEKVTALSLITASPTRVTLVELTGDIDLTSVSELNKTLNIKGLENLNKINGQSDFTLYEKFNGDFYFKFNDDQHLKLLDEQMKALKDQKFIEFESKAREFSQQQKELAEKAREMAEKYQRHPIFLSAPGDTNMIYIVDGKKVNAKEIKNLQPDQIKSIQIIKQDKEKPGKKGEIRITTGK
jgi:hypothetical protein